MIWFLLLTVLLIGVVVWRIKDLKEKKPTGKALVGHIFAGIGIFLVALFFGAGIADHFTNGDDDSTTKTTQTAKVDKQKAKKKALEAKKKAEAKKRKEEKKKELEIKDGQQVMTEDLANNPDLRQFVQSIDYQGDGNAQVKVTDDFLVLSEAERYVVAKTVNNIVTSASEDVDLDDKGIDRYSMLIFVTRTGEPIGRSKITDHNSYKWSK